MLKGIDVSLYQPQIDYKAVAADGIKFAFVKCSQQDYLDPYWARHRAGFAKVGIPVGPYCFLCPGKVDAATHYETFRRGIMETGGWEGLLTPALDWEGDDHTSIKDMPGKTTGAKWAAYRNWGVEWLQRLYDDTGVRGIVYMNRTFANMAGGAFRQYPLWAAVPGENAAACKEPKKLVSAAAWGCKKTLFQQWNFWGKVAGISGNGLDLDVFDGTEQDLQALIMGPLYTSVKVVNHATGALLETLHVVRGGDHIADQGKLYVRGGAK